MLKKSVFFVVFVIVFSSIGFAQNIVDNNLKKCFSERIHDLQNSEVNGLSVYQNFEDKLILEGKLVDNSQESYAMLMANLLNDDISVPVNYWGAVDNDIAVISMPSNLTATMFCYTDMDATTRLSYSSSISNMMPFLKEIILDFNIGDKTTNIQLIRSIHAEDFNNIIYKAPILALVNAVAVYKEEMNVLTSNF